MSFVVCKEELLLDGFMSSCAIAQISHFLTFRGWLHTFELLKDVWASSGQLCLAQVTEQSVVGVVPCEKDTVAPDVGHTTRVRRMGTGGLGILGGV